MNDDICKQEIWKDINGYKGLYQVSNLGRVKSLDRYIKQGNRTIKFKSKILKQRLERNGYLRVTLYKNATPKQISVHRLVAETFINNPNNLPQVNHIDKNREHNYVTNLEWCTSLYNLQYSNIIKNLSKTKYKKIICNTTGEIFDSIKSASEKYNLQHSNIIKCCKGERNMTGGLKWSYYD